MKSVVVTGASTGIGWACLKVLIAGGFRVFGGVRKQADADRLAKEFGANFTPLLFDVTDAAAVAAAAGKVRAALGGETLFGLVNNAGIAVPGPLLELSVEDFRRQIDVNLIGQFIVTQAFGPLLGADRSLKGPPGRIVMISSISGKTAFPFGGAYAASKFGLEGLSEALRRELMIFGVDVIVGSARQRGDPDLGQVGRRRRRSVRRFALRARARPGQALCARNGQEGVAAREDRRNGQDRAHSRQAEDALFPGSRSDHQPDNEEVPQARGRQIDRRPVGTQKNVRAHDSAVFA